MPDIDINERGGRSSKVQLEQQQYPRYGTPQSFIEPEYPRRFQLKPLRETSFIEYVLGTVGVILLLFCLYRIFFVREKSNYDIAITILTFGFLSATLIHFLSAVFIRTRRALMELQFIVLPNGLPVSYKTILNNYENLPELILEQTGYYDVKHAQAANPLVAPGEITLTQSPQYMYAPQTSNGGSYRDVIEDAIEAQEGETEDIIPFDPLPERVELFSILTHREEGHIILGVDENNTVVQYPMLRMFNHLVGGAVGSGKSIYLRSLVYQLVVMAEDGEYPINLMLADIEDNTFPEFRNCKYVSTYASSYNEVEKMTSYLIKEVERRKTLYEQQKVIPRDIERYNAGKPDEVLPIIVAVYDEFSALMNKAHGSHKKILGDILQLVLRARKYGIFLIVAGQTFKADIVDSSVLGQFYCTTAFQVRDTAQSMMLLGKPGAEKLARPGQALIKTKEGTLARIQTPYFDDDEFLDELTPFLTKKTSASIPSIAQDIIDYSTDMLDGYVRSKEIETYMRDRGISRGQVLENISWMERNGLIVRGDKNARKLNHAAINNYKDA